MQFSEVFYLIFSSFFEKSLTSIIVYVQGTQHDGLICITVTNGTRVADNPDQMYGLGREGYTTLV